MVGDYINTIKTFFIKVLILSTFFRITSLQLNKEKLFYLTASFCFHVNVYPSCSKACYNPKLKLKVIDLCDDDCMK